MKDFSQQEWLEVWINYPVLYLIYYWIFYIHVLCYWLKCAYVSFKYIRISNMECWRKIARHGKIKSWKHLKFNNKIILHTSDKIIKKKTKGKNTIWNSITLGDKRKEDKIGRWNIRTFVGIGNILILKKGN